MNSPERGFSYALLFSIMQNKYLPPKAEKIYVKVTSDFDATGYMQPRCITWDDGRTFRIDEIRDFRPASSMGSMERGDCYTVIICGEEKHLFFERTDPLFHSRYGRWFVEVYH